MKEIITILTLCVLSFQSLADSSFMSDCKRLMYKDQLAYLTEVKNVVEQARKEAPPEELPMIEKQYQAIKDNFENQVLEACSCIKKQVVDSLELIGESEQSIQPKLDSLGQAMLSGNYWGIDEETRAAFEQASQCAI